MEKIGLLSVKTHNYGSLLQTYALQQYLNIIGYENEIIEYKKTNYFKQAIRLFNIPLLRKEIKKVKKKLVSRKNIELSELFLNRKNTFDKYIKTNLVFSKTYVGRKDLINGAKNYNGFVLGSDQVWNPMNYGGDFFTMTFVPDEICKIAYAPSFGVAQIPSHQKKGTIQYLNRINFLSVREDSGRKLIKELTGRDVKVVADPTILLPVEYWERVTENPIINKPYILCYFLSDNKTHREYAKKLSKKTGFQIVSFPHMEQIVEADYEFADTILQDIGPHEFINLIRYSKYVCTDSFHCTVFSIIFNKQFLTFNRYAMNSKDSTNSRLDSILKLCGLEKRKEDSKNATCDQMFNSIEYETVNKTIDIFRKSSQDFLVDALNSVEFRND